MKRNILAVIIPTLLVAGVANAVEIHNDNGNKLTLHGKVNGLHYLSDKDDRNGDNTYVGFGFKGEMKINDQLTGYSQWEYNIKANNSESSDSQSGNKIRLGFTGLRFGKFGSFDYGRNYGVVYDAVGWTNILPEFGGNPAYADNFFVGRNSGLATYRNTNFFGLVEGLNFAIQYQGKNKESVQTNNGRGIQQANGNGYAFSTTYTTPVGLSFSAAYGSGNRTDKQKEAFFGKKKERAEQWATAVKYDANNIRLAAMYSETYGATFIKNENTTSSSIAADKVGFANKAKQIELVAQYRFDFGLRPSIAYVQSKAKGVEGDIGSVDLTKYVEVGATYYFNKNMYTYVDYLINQINDDNKLGVDSGNAIALGLVYQF